MTPKEFLLTDPNIDEAVSNGYDIRLEEHEWLVKMQEYSDLQNAELKAEIERLNEEYSRLEYKCEYGIWPKPGM